MRSKKRFWILIVLAILFSGVPSASFSGVLDVAVMDEKGGAVKDAVVYAVIRDDAASRVSHDGKAVIDQVDKEFIPYVMPLKVGTAVYFPNHDQIRHHVYSFSDIKKFEIPLYIGTPANPVVFDKPGVVVLGCNIHDWMSAYVYILETPFYSVTGADGKAKIENLPSGEYDIQIWHPGIKAKPQSIKRQITAAGESPEAVIFKINQVKILRQWRAPTSSIGGYR
jgi:plastocyanin